MDIENVLAIPRARRLFVLKEKIREGVELDGVKNGLNLVFTIPGGEKAIHDPPRSQVKLYRNGVRQLIGFGNDYIVSESGGPGTGVDTLTIVPAPLAKETLLVDFLLV